MQPYQKAEQAARRSGEYPINLAKNASLSFVGGALAKSGAGAAASLIPKIKALINDYVPDELSKKGLEKLDPRFKGFIDGAMNEGEYDYKDIRGFLGEKVAKSEQQISQQMGNIIEQESPELHQFILDQIKSGRKPLEAAAIAQNDKRFNEVINKLSKTHKTPWSGIIESVFGKGDMGLPQEQQEGPPTQDQPNQQEGPGQASLMAILEKINQIRNGRQ